nr:tripartite tricarboxylate transporter substrate binding protein [Pseudomonas sp.]
MKGLWNKFPGLLACSLAALTLGVLPGLAGAQEYPQKRISIVAPVAPGSPFDLLTRVFTDRLGKKLGVPVIVENVTGGQGLIATHRVLNSESDGYTLLLSSTGIATGPLVLKNPGYTMDDFAPLAALGQAAYLLLASSSVEATNVPSLMSYMKSNGNKMNFGVLTASPLSVLLARQFGVAAQAQNVTEIGYRGSADMIRALIADEIQMIATTYSVAAPHLDSGRVKAIGVLGDQRIRQLPDLSTFKEEGYPSLYINVWAALFAKSDVPPQVLETLRKASQEILSDPSFLKAMEPTGMDPWVVPYDKLEAVINEEATTFAANAKQFNLTFE